MKSLSILLVDRDASVRTTIGKLLAKASHRVTEAASFQDALHFLDETQFEVVLTDMLLGESDGLDVLQAARAKQPDARTVMMSSGGSALNGSYGLNFAGGLEADEQLRKPFSYSELLTAVEGSMVLAAATR